MVDLNALAQRVADELARGDAKLGNGAPASGSATPSVVVTQPVVPAGVKYVREQARIAEFIDHTLLRAETTRAEVEKLCDEAREHHFAAVCVNPAWVALCHERLAGSAVKVATVIGFPLGASTPEGKAAEARLAVRDGADELDMVAALGHIKSGDWHHVARDIEGVVRAAEGRLVKVIIESAALTPVEVVKASALARESGANYVKTSTGFHTAGGASAEAVALMRLAVGDSLGVKASGGIRDCDTALRMIAAGATRLGTSSGVAMSECLGRGPLPLRELLSSPHQHNAQCASGSCGVPGGGSAY
jgi:deoxyribose-phosphate aldolase